MTTYTLQDLELFRAIVADLRAIQQIDGATGQHFHLLGWLRQIGEPPGWQVTKLGEEHLE